MDDTAAGPVFRWEVGADQIDLPHWAHVFVELRVQAKERERSIPTWFWPAWLVLVITLGLLTSPIAAGVLLATAGAGYVGARWWNRSAADRMARRLERIPAAHEAFTFEADARGTTSTSASSAERLDWSRFKGVVLHEELIVLTHDTDVMRMLPVASLVSGQPPEAAVATIAAWITPLPPLPEV